MSKNAKNSQIKQMTSLDEKHQEMLDKFKSNQLEHIPKLKKDMNSIKELIKTLPKSKIDTILDLKDELKEKKNTIKRLRNEEREYPLELNLHNHNQFVPL